jgi:hypothetical protein
MEEDRSTRPFENLLLNEQLREGTTEERLAEFDLEIEVAAKVREFQETRNLRLLPTYLRFRTRAKKYFLKYGDYFLF